MTYGAREKPVVLIRVNGKHRPDLEERRIGLTYNDRMGKRDEAEIVFADADRKIMDGDLLQPDDIFEVTWGYPGNMTRPRTLRLKDWVPNYNADFPSVRVKLKVTSAKPQRKGKRRSTEPHTTQRPRNWGKVESTVIARRIARRHRLKFKGDASDDLDVPFYQPGNVSDYEYLQQLASDIDFECFIEGDTLYYRKKPYDERPRRVFYYNPPNAGSSLLISFSPTVKVVKAGVKPRGTDTTKGDPAARLDATLAGINAEVVDLTGQKAVTAQAGVAAAEGKSTEDFQSALAAQTGFKLDPNLSTAAQAAQTRAALEGGIKGLKQARADRRAAKQASGVLAHEQSSIQVNSQVAGDGNNCGGKGTNKPGSTPIGDPSTQDAVVLGLGNSRDLTYLPASNAQSVVTPSVDAKKRKKEACASFAKMKDRAVTAEAEMWGDPSIRSKVNYEFRGVGRRFEGSWYSKDTVHTVTETWTIRMKLKRGTLRKVKKGKGSKSAGKDPGASTPQNTEVVVLGIANDRTARIETRPSVPAK